MPYVFGTERTKQEPEDSPEESASHAKWLVETRIELAHDRLRYLESIGSTRTKADCLVVRQEIQQLEKRLQEMRNK